METQIKKDDKKKSGCKPTEQPKAIKKTGGKKKQTKK